MAELFGNIHSIESCGTVDGPGVRFVVFLQGCPMRCMYCHNPDTWGISENSKMSISDILSQYDSVKEFCKGGITVTGGEPLLQIDFVTELFKEAKKKNIHTALDTSGVMFSLHPNPPRPGREQKITPSPDGEGWDGVIFTDNNKISRKQQTDNSLPSYPPTLLSSIFPSHLEGRGEGANAKFDELLKYTDLVLLDIKHIDDEEHKKLTGHSNKNILEFAKYLSEKQIPVWIRHVVVPEITFKKEYLIRLGEFLKTLKNIKALDVLPYHNMAIPKYESLNIDYPLKETQPLTKEEAIQARNWILEGMKT